MSGDIDKNLSLTDVLELCAEGLLPTGSAIMDGDTEIWPHRKVEESEVFFYPEGYEEEEDD